MEQTLQHLFPLLVLMPLLMGVLSFIKSHNYKQIEFRHLGEFYLSITLVTTSSWFLLPMGDAYIILSMLPWMWMLRTFGLICEDISKEALFNKMHLYVLGLGGVISIIFLSFDFTLEMVATPFSLGVGFIGLTFIFQAYSKGKRGSYGFLHHINLFMVLVFFLSRLIFPLLLAPPVNIQHASLIDAYLLLAFCATLYPLYAQIIFEGRERLLENVLATRNKQLLSHSGFSEYKILSAGLSHEVNNALTIINAKLTRLMRNKMTDPEKDLQVIQNATNRIVNSIRGLREFIYPHEMQEVLDLGEIVNEVLSLYGQRLINHNVRVDLSALNGKLVKGQRIQLEQVFLSLINNSVDSIDELEEKWIKISAKGVTGLVQITYQDSSPSNYQDIASLLSDPIYSFREFMDNDIRLVLVKDIVERHGGSLVCMHHPEFSTFSITLPLANASKSTSTNLYNKIEEIKELH